MHTAKDDAKATSQPPVDDPSLPVHDKHSAKQAAHMPSAAASKRASTCQKSGSSFSDRSQSSGRPAPAPQQRKRRHETPAALADPLGAFASQATQRQRTLQSGLNLLKGKTSQARIVAPNLRPPNKHVAAQLDTYRFQSANAAAQPAAQPTKADKHTNRQQSQEQTPQQQSPDQHRKKQNGHRQTEMANVNTKRTQSVDVQPPDPSQYSISNDTAQDLNTAPKKAKANGNYFKDIKHSIHALVQANHTIPSLHAMSDTDKAALTSMLTNKLDGVNILSELQQRFSSKPWAAVQSADQQQPSAASSVDCSPSPSSVAQRDAQPHRLSRPAVPNQHAQLRAMPTVDASYTSHASAASSGSGHRHSLTGDACLSSRPSGYKHVLRDDGQLNSRLTAADSDVGLFDLHTEPMHNHYSLMKGQGRSYSRESNAMSLDANAAAPPDLSKIDWYAPLCQTTEAFKVLLRLHHGAPLAGMMLSSKRVRMPCKVVLNHFVLLSVMHGQTLDMACILYATVGILPTCTDMLS